MVEGRLGMTARRMGGDGMALDARSAPGERRRAERIDSVIRATVRLLGAGSPAVASPVRARALDICDHGVRLMLRKRIDVGQLIELDLECELPLRVHLGYDADSLIIDGPMHTHLVRVEARVVRSERAPNRFWEIGAEFDTRAGYHDLRFVQHYVDHLRDQESWAI